MVARPALEPLRVFVASPGDVVAEREHVKAVADELNRGTAAQAGFVLEVVRWETHARPDMGRPEQLILDQIGPYDLFVGIMWRRFGTPTGVAGSGTEEEFHHALRAWQQSRQPRLLCYFSRAPTEPPETVDEATQLLKVTQFRSQVETQGLAWRYRSDAEFKDCLREHLQHILWEFADRRPPLDRNRLAPPDADLPPVAGSGRAATTKRWLPAKICLAVEVRQAVPRGCRRLGDEEVQIAADRGQGVAADAAQPTSGSLIGQGTNLFRHGIRNLLQPGAVIGRNLYVMVEVPVAGGERHGEEQPGNH